MACICIRRTKDDRKRLLVEIGPLHARVEELRSEVSEIDKKIRALLAQKQEKTEEMEMCSNREVAKTRVLECLNERQKKDLGSGQLSITD